jgi:hypothetical protein
VKFIPGGSMEYEAVVVKLSSSEALRVLHELAQFNPLTHRRGNARSGGRGRPYSEPTVAIKATATANSVVLRI